MQTRIIYFLLLGVNYSLNITDLRHFVHHYWESTETLVFLAVILFIILIDYLILSNALLTIITKKQRRRAQLVLHIALALNSVGWTVYEGTYNSGTIIFIIMLAINIVLIHKWLHKIIDLDHDNNNKD